MDQESGVDPRAEGKHPSRYIQRNTVNIYSQKLDEAWINIFHDQQRGQKVLTELPVGHPRFSLAIGFKREGVYEERSSPHELDIVIAGVF